MVVDDGSTLCSLVRAFAEQTNMHGVGSMFRRGAGWLRRLLWSAILGLSWYAVGQLLLRSVVALVDAADALQFIVIVIDLYTKYSSHQVSSVIEIKQENQLNFPAITLCNLNPLQVHVMDAYREVVDGMGLRDTTVHKLMWMKQLIATNYETPRLQPPPPPPPPPPGRKRRSVTVPPDFTDAVDDGDMDNAVLQAVQDKLVERGVDTNATEYWTSVEGTASGDDPISWLMANFVRTMNLLTPVEQRLLGHNMQAMLVNCQINQQVCTPKNFTKRWNPRYGNCYTFNSGYKWSAAGGLVNRSLSMSSTGASNGLTMELFVQQHEYIKELTANVGLKLVIHEPGRMAFPEDEGFQLAPGSDTNMGIRLKEVRRLGEPFTNCIEGFYADKNMYDIKAGPVQYSTQACLKTCMQRMTMQHCNCSRADLPRKAYALRNELDRLSLYYNESSRIPICNVSRPLISKCVQKVNQLIETSDPQFTALCACPQSCSDKIYQVSSSMSRWPTKDYVAMLKPDLKARSDFWNKTLSGYQPPPEQPAQPAEQRHKRQAPPPPPPGGQGMFKPPTDDQILEKLERNLVKVQVYFEDLNYELVYQTEAYSNMSLLSDVGGNMGMWVGLSVVAAFELVEVLFDLAFLVCAFDYFGYRKRSKQQAAAAKEPAAVAVSTKADESKKAVGANLE